MTNVQGLGWLHYGLLKYSISHWLPTVVWHIPSRVFSSHPFQNLFRRDIQHHQLQPTIIMAAGKYSPYGALPFPKVSRVHNFIAKGLGATMWFWIFYRLREVGH